MFIIGAGISGLLAARMLRHKEPVILEKQASLPNNHSAVLRFRSDVVANVTGIEFKKVQVIKGSLAWRNPIADALSYAEKNTGKMRSDRSLPTSVSTVERYIAPPDFIAQLADGLEANGSIEFNADVIDRFDFCKANISTIPMPDLMHILNYPDIPEFHIVSGTNMVAKVSRCDAYVSLYVPSPFYHFSRISLTGDDLIVEFPHEETNHEMIYAAAGLVGIARDRLSDIEVKPQKYAKIQPIDERVRKTFIAWASDKHNVYSLGRYACWRPSLLLDDLVQDIRLIEKWINNGEYAMRRQR